MHGTSVAIIAESRMMPVMMVFVRYIYGMVGEPAVRTRDGGIPLI